MSFNRTRTISSLGRWIRPPWQDAVARSFACSALMTALLVAGAPSLRADEYPSRPIHLVIPWSPGGTNDLIGRLVGQELSKTLGQTTVVENRPGASGIIGARDVAQANPDGYTLLLTSNSLALTAAMQPETMGFDVSKDLDPIVLAASSTSALVVNTSVPATSVADLVALAKQKPGFLTAGTAGAGSPSAFLLDDFTARTGIDVLAVPYKAAPKIWLALLSGEISFAFVNLQQVQSSAADSPVRMLAVASKKRSPLVPDVPTLDEAGVSGMVENHWMGYFAPAHTPDPIIRRLAQAINAALTLPTVKSTLAKLGMDADSESTPESFAADVKNDIQRYREVLKRSGSDSR